MDPEPPSFTTISGQKKIILIIGGIVILGLLALLAGLLLPSSPHKQTEKTAAKLTPSNIPSDIPTSIPTIDTAQFPSPSGSVSATAYPGPFYNPNHRQNDLTIKVYQAADGDAIDQVQLINTKTTEVRIIGMALDSSPGDSAFFSKDYSQVIFLGGSNENNIEAISFYSIAQNKIVRQVSLSDIQRALPMLQQPPEAILSRLLLSPNGQKLAFSYGDTYNVTQIDPKTNIIVTDISTHTIKLIGANGLVKAWKDDTTLQYETSTNDPNNNTVQEVSAQ